jgi:hypothetical protein
MKINEEAYEREEGRASNDDERRGIAKEGWRSKK